MRSTNRLLALTLLVLASCSPLAPRLTPAEGTMPDWAYTDLRGIDPPDAPQPDQDILAGYLRRSPNSASGLDLRLDFLELALDSKQNVLLAFDYLPGGVPALPFGAPIDIEWDALLELPADGPIQGINRQLGTLPGLRVQQLHNPEQDNLQIRLDGGAFFGSNYSSLPPAIKVQAFTTSARFEQVFDRSPVLRLSAPPPEPVRLLLAFWNTFPAYTPAQALRRWDGAHTGLFGGRYGLYNLLRAARNHSLPLVLLDLNTPPSLSALDYGGNLDLVESLASSGILSAPQVWVGGGNDDLEEFLIEQAESFGLPKTEIGYAQSAASLPERLQLVFLPGKNTAPFTQVSRSKSQKIVLLPAAVLEENTSLRLAPDGLSLESRKLLAEAAARPNNPSELAVLGGDLAQSGWGSPEAARGAFDYIRDHPWIRVLSTQALEAEPPSSIFDPASQLLGLKPASPFDFPQSNSSPLVEAAKQSIEASPRDLNAPPSFANLEEIYAPQARILLAAAEWASHPAPIATCAEDIDLDGKPECILASEKVYTVFDLELGALTHAFYIGADGPHQWIAPSSQLSYGTGDPAAWDLSAGLAADPAVIPGAFADPLRKDGELETAQIQPGKLVLSSPSGLLIKAFTLLEDGLQVDIEGQNSRTRLPLVVDPWLRFQPGWGGLYHGGSTEQGATWGTDDFQVQITSPQPLALSAFNDTRQLMGQVENPNTEYPAGHYLPFPMALVEASVEPDLHLNILIRTR